MDRVFHMHHHSMAKSNLFEKGLLFFVLKRNFGIVTYFILFLKRKKIKNLSES